MPGTMRALEEMQPVETQSEHLVPEEGPAIGFHSLPNEVVVAVAREVAKLPNGRDDLTNLRRTNNHINGLILDSGIESRYVAVCLDVVGNRELRGMSVPDALRQNGPLPDADEKLHATDVADALKHATPDQLANLAEDFSARTGPASKEALNGVARAIQSYDREPRLSSASIDTLATLAGAYFEGNGVPRCSESSGVIEEVSVRLFERRADLMHQANIEQIAKLASALATCPEDSADHCLDLLAWQVIERDLLPDASREQLAALKVGFELVEGTEGYDDRKSVFAMVAMEMANRDAATLPRQDSRHRPQLDNRDNRDRSSVER
jgi:curved DNA-binding protein CbpA